MVGAISRTRGDHTSIEAVAGRRDALDPQPSPAVGVRSVGERTAEGTLCAAALYHWRAPDLGLSPAEAVDRILSWSAHTRPVNAAIGANHATPAWVGSSNRRADHRSRNYAGGHCRSPKTPMSAAPSPTASATPAAPPHLLDLWRKRLFSNGCRRKGESRCGADLRRHHRDRGNCAQKRASLMFHDHSSFKGCVWDQGGIWTCARFRQASRMLCRSFGAIYGVEQI
jgi:hypothetical protein